MGYGFKWHDEPKTDILDRIARAVPCGDTQGHGEICVMGHLCSQCSLLLDAATEIRRLRGVQGK